MRSSQNNMLLIRFFIKIHLAVDTLLTNGEFQPLFLEKKTYSEKKNLFFYFVQIFHIGTVELQFLMYMLWDFGWYPYSNLIYLGSIFLNE